MAGVSAHIHCFARRFTDGLALFGRLCRFGLGLDGRFLGFAFACGGLAELLDAFAQRSANFANPAGSKQEQHNAKD